MNSAIHRLGHRPIRNELLALIFCRALRQTGRGNRRRIRHERIEVRTEDLTFLDKLFGLEDRMMERPEASGCGHAPALPPV